MIKFRDLIEENRSGIKLTDVTFINKNIVLKSNYNKFFVITEWSEEDKENTILLRDIRKSTHKWNILSSIKPDFIYSFPIKDMVEYSNYTKQINVKYALQDIQTKSWNKEG